MWCLGCCPCWKGSDKTELKEDSGLLTSPQWQSDGDAIKTRYYTVSRIASFGRTGSGEDISDIGRDQDEDMRSPAEFWTAEIQMVQPDVTGSGYDGHFSDTMSPRPPCLPSLPKSCGRRALHPFKPWNERNKSREQKEAADLTVSLPDLDINTGIPSHDKDGSCVKTSIKETGTAHIARTYGLDTSLYTSNNTECTLISRSYEALNSQRLPGWLCEVSYGIIEFTATYLQKSKKLLVHVDKVEHLPPKGEHYTYSVVVKLIILPLNKPVHVSRIYKHDLNPVIEEDFEFTVKHPLGKVLRLSLYDADYQGKYDAIGHALLCLEDVMAEKFRRYSLRLYKQSQPDVHPGNIRVSLSYKREAMVMTVLVMEACNLLLSTGAAKNNRLPDKYNTYVKVVYLSCGQKIQSKRSAVVSNNRNPTYNATFTFKLSSNILYESFIVVSVMMKELLRKDVPIGRLVLGPFQYTEGRERTPWGRALLSQEKVTHWFKMYL